MAALVLASSSPHRRTLLERLGLPFDVAAPGIDESPLPGELPEDLVMRLSQAKARAIAAERANAIVIGSDQVAAAPAKPNPIILGKPGSRSGAIEQLRMLSGRWVNFLSGLCVVDSAGNAEVEIETAQVLFRALNEREIANYVDREQPFDCAASFRSERLGIALVESMRVADPNALVGLPLIRLAQMLRRTGLDPLR